MDLAINRDQRGPEGPAMAEINARALMFNLGREDAIDSTTSAKIARYAERKRLAYKLTDEGVLLLDGRGKKIHLRNGVVTLRNALGLHALPERCHAIGDNRVLNKQQQHTNVVTMLHVRKMALVDPRLLKSLRENPTPLPDAIDTTLRDLDAKVWRYVAVTRSISFTIYYEIEKHPTPSDGSSSPTKCAPPTYPWNWSVTSQGDYTCKRNAVNGLRRNVLRRRNGRLYKFPIRSVRPFRRRRHDHGAAAIETTPKLLRS